MVTYFDVEWANGKNRSICQIGIICENYGDVEPVCFEKNIYVNPEDDFDYSCERVHHITAKEVAQERTFPQVWNDIKKYFVDSIVIGYNVAGADLDALTKCLQRYNLDIPKLKYVDLREIVREIIRDHTFETLEFKTVCDHYNVKICREHDAFFDARACRDLLLALRKKYQIDIDMFTHKYVATGNFVFDDYVSNTHLNQAICELYGFIQGMTFDNQLSNDEIAYIVNWKKDNIRLVNDSKIADIFDIIDTIQNDKRITSEVRSTLHKTMSNYFNTISSAEQTRATQILRGILRGIVSDKTISESECVELQKWLYEHECFIGRYPFAEIVKCLDDVLQDNIITEGEQKFLLDKIDEILQPIDKLKTHVYSVNGRKVCLTGEFKYGSKNDVKNFIVTRGGIVCDSVTKKLDFLLVGDLGSDAYSYGTHGSKINKAKEYNEKYHTDILIVREEDFFSTIK